MNWFLLSLISVITFSIANFLQRLLMKDKNSSVIGYAITFQLISAILVGFFSFTRGFLMPPLQELWFNFVLMTILYGVGTLLFLKALQIMELSKTVIIISSRMIWTVVISLLFLGETLNFIQIAGIVLIFSSVILISFKKEILQFDKRILYPLGAAFCFGVAFANDAFILKQSDVFSYTTLAFLFPGLFILVSKPKIIIEMKTFFNIVIFLKIILLSFFLSISAITIYLAYQQGGNASQLAPISQSSIILTVLLAVIFLNERSQLKQKFISLIMMITGILLLK